MEITAAVVYERNGPFHIEGVKLAEPGVANCWSGS